MDGCDHTGKTAKRVGVYRVAPLADGHHTSFMVLKCLSCNGVFGFPDDNYQLAKKEGTEETKKKLAEIEAKHSLENVG